MIVAELIEKLKTCDPNAAVLIGDGDKFGEGFSGIAEVVDQNGRVIIRERS